MITTRMAAVLCTAALFAAQDAAAQGTSKAQALQAIKTQIAGAEAEAPQLEQRNEALVQDSQMAKKEWDLYPPQIQRHNGEVRAYQARVAAHERDAKAQNAEAANFRAQCLGRQLPPGEYQSCTAWQGRVNGWAQQVNARKGVLDREHARLNTQKRNYDQRMDQLKARMQRNLAQSEQIQARLRALRERVAKLREQFGSTCASLQKDDADVGEAEAHCKSVDFDGTKPHLPPLGKPKPPFSVQPN